jgi:hypothetical protein
MQKRQGYWIICGLILAVSVAVDAAPPRLLVAEPIIDLGTVAPGEELEATFSLENQGDEPLTIDARPTCGCTVAQWDKSVAPGETGEIHTTIDTSNLRGKVTKSIMVISNDPELPTTRLVLNVEVRPVLEILPRPIVRLQAKQGEAASTAVVLSPIDAENAELEIIAIEPAAPYVTVTSRKLKPTGEEDTAGRHEITINLDESAPIGLVNVPVTVKTNHPKAATVSIRVVGTVTSS